MNTALLSSGIPSHGVAHAQLSSCTTTSEIYSSGKSCAITSSEVSFGSAQPLAFSKQAHPLSNDAAPQSRAAVSLPTHCQPKPRALHVQQVQQLASQPAAYWPSGAPAAAANIQELNIQYRVAQTAALRVASSRQHFCASSAFVPVVQKTGNSATH